MDIKFDSYTRKARLLPALIVILPLSIATSSVTPEGIFGWDLIWALIVFSGGTLLMAELGRDMGKNKEERLYKIWGGKPSLILLRHKNNRNKILLNIRHQKLGLLISDIDVPSLEKEKNNKNEADEIYEVCSTFLRNNTRDKKMFPLVYKELCSYGFRRNLWGMKPLGILISFISIFLLTFSIYKSAGDIQEIILISFVIVLCLMLMWLFRINKKWVKTAAFAYAERLLESIDKIEKK